MTRPKLIKTLQGHLNDTPPVWFMRQAGRYLSEYKEVRSTTSSFMEFCYSPDKAAQVTLQPISRFNFDAAIIFSDILVIPHALGRDVNFVKGEGPKLTPIENHDAIEALSFDKNILSPVYQALGLVKEKLPTDKALIGFAGAPWTLLTYMIEGGSSRDFEKTKQFAYKTPVSFTLLLEKLTLAVTEHLIAQIKAGAQTVQLFDSWAGAIPDRLFEEACLKPFTEIVSNVKKAFPDVPIIGFPRGVGAKYQFFAEQTGVDALSIDQFTSWKWAAENISVPIQGNLDPVLLANNIALAKKEAQNIIDIAKERPYVFNLGHGILPYTPISHVEEVLKTIRG